MVATKVMPSETSVDPAHAEFSGLGKSALPQPQDRLPAPLHGWQRNTVAACVSKWLCFQGGAWWWRQHLLAGTRRALVNRRAGLMSLIYASPRGMTSPFCYGLCSSGFGECLMLARDFLGWPAGGEKTNWVCLFFQSWRGTGRRIEQGLRPQTKNLPGEAVESLIKIRIKIKKSEVTKLRLARAPRGWSGFSDKRQKVKVASV